MRCGLLKPRTTFAGRPSTIPALLHRSVEREPSADAVATLKETLTFRELESRTAVFARALIGAGVGKGTRIALLAPDGVLWLTAFLAATRIGALVAAVSTHAAAPELAHILRHSDAQILIAVRRFLRHDYGERIAAAIPSLVQCRQGPLYVEEAPYLRSIWLDDAQGLPWASSHDSLLEGPKPGAAHLAAIEQEVTPSDDAVIIYTSGSSALPKAVVHTHASTAQHSQVLAEHFRMAPFDRMMPLLPLFWVGGLTMALEVLSVGGTLVYPASPAMDDVIAAMFGLGVTRVNSWGLQLEKLRAAATAAGVDVHSIGGLGPQRTPDGVIIPDDRTANMLGMTESFGPHSSELLGTLLPEERRGASGRATSDYERRVVDPETGEVLGPGRSGELQIRRGGLMRGFYKMSPDAVFTPDGFYPTGDTVRIDEEDNLFFEGRRSDMLKTAGANVSRLEVEAALRSHPDVDLPVVVGLRHLELGHIVVAAVVPAQGRTPTEETLKVDLREVLASYKVPKHIVFISADEVPWTPSQKVKLGDLTALLTERLADRLSVQEEGA